MKKLLFVFALLGVFSIAANAQSCCAKKSGASCSKTAAVSAEDAAAIAKLVANDPSIEKRKDSATGAECYVRKEVCEKSGKVSFYNVEYNSKEGKFVNVGPSDAAGSTKSCSSKSACSKNASSSCCAKKGSTAEATSAPAKLMSNGSK